MTGCPQYGATCALDVGLELDNGVASEFRRHRAPIMRNGAYQIHNSSLAEACADNAPRVLSEAVSKRENAAPYGDGIQAVDRNNDAYEIRFRSLFQEGRGLAFPCDAQGRVDLDNLTNAGRHNYLYARALVGREFATPHVRRRDNL